MQFDVQSVIRRIEIRLAEIGMTKQEFYEKSGISSGSFSQWNTGKHAPSIKKVQRAASVIGVTTEYLLYGTDLLPDEEPPAGIKKDPIRGDGAEDSETAELREIWSSADENERRDLLEMARMLKSRRKQNG